MSNARGWAHLWPQYLETNCGKAKRNPLCTVNAVTSGRPVPMSNMGSQIARRVGGGRGAGSALAAGNHGEGGSLIVSPSQWVQPRRFASLSYVLHVETLILRGTHSK